MISYHPDSRFLTDFASANLPLSEAVCVSAHLEFCGKCRAHVQQLADIGGHLLSRLQPETLEQDSFERLMGRIDAQEVAGQRSDALVEGSDTVMTPAASVAPKVESHSRNESPRGATGVSMPRALRQLTQGGLQNLRWVQLGKALRVAPLYIDEGVRETAIYDIKAGGKMPEHEHRGEEITVLLRGSFSDAEGSYTRGDFVVRNAGEAHQPMATQDMDCLCLVSLERPVRPRSWFYRLLEPFVQHQLHKAATIR